MRLGVENKLIYVASPFKGPFWKRWRNILYARKACKYILKTGNVPLAPHLLFPQFTRDEEWAADTCFVLQRLCSEVWFFTRYGWSEGMKVELKTALELDQEICLEKL
jgi:hypothetical protein